MLAFLGRAGKPMMQGHRPVTAPQWARCWLQGHSLLSQKVRSSADKPKAPGLQQRQRLTMCSTSDACMVSILRTRQGWGMSHLSLGEDGNRLGDGQGCTAVQGLWEVMRRWSSGWTKKPLPQQAVTTTWQHLRRTPGRPPQPTQACTCPGAARHCPGAPSRPALVCAGARLPRPLQRA